MRTSVVFLIGLFLGAVGWHIYTTRLAQSGSSGIPLLDRLQPERLPINRVIHDRNGKALSVRILAQNGVDVQFTRLSDGTHYQYPISWLSPEDQVFIRGLTSSTLLPLPKSTPTPDGGGGQQDFAEVSRLTQQKYDLERKIGDLEFELKKVDDKNPRLPRGEVERRINEYRNTLIDVEQRLAELQ